MNTLKTLGLIAALALASACDRGATATVQEGQPSTTSASPTDHAAQPAAANAPLALQLTVDGSGYHPSSLNAPPNQTVRLTITRTSDEGCGQQIVFPSLNIRRDLPLNQAVTVELTMPASGNVAFTCGMDMLRGSIVAG